ncbi:MAG: GntR family transcriptional regulator [Pseudomonadota bacterium]
MVSIETIERPTLHEELVVRLRDLIIEDRLKPGEKIPEKELCEAFGVSRTPLREALKVLASEGFVTLQANRGARVTEATREELLDAFAILAVLEQLAGELACGMLDQSDMRWIEGRHEAMLDAYANRKRKRYFRANQDIHQALIRASGNALLEGHHKLLAARVQRARFLVNMSEERWAQAVEEHEQMMVKLRKGDSKGLGRIMKQHIVNKCAAILAAFDATGAEKV